MAIRGGLGVGRVPVLVWALVVFGLLAANAAPVHAQEEAGAEAAEEEVKPWSNEAEASFVKTSGNSTTTTVALSNRFAYNLTYSEFVFNVSYLRNSNTVTDRLNVDGELVEATRTETTADRAEVALGYRHNILDNMFWFARGSWYRNRPAGVNSELHGGGGVGYRFIENEGSLLVGELGLGITDESLIGAEGDTFIDVRGTLEGRFPISATSDFEALFEIANDLQNTSNRRMKLDTAVTVAMSNALALRIGYLLDYRNEPVEEVILGGEGVAPVVYVRDKTDSMFLVSLVLKF